MMEDEQGAVGGYDVRYPDNASQSDDEQTERKTSEHGALTNYDVRQLNDTSSEVDDTERQTCLSMQRGRERRRQTVTRRERLWEFFLRLLGDPKHNPRLIEWVDREDGTFRINNSRAIANMWCMRKNNLQMTYETISRALRYYYHRQILEPVLGKKLVYRFGPNAVEVWKHRTYRPQAPDSRHQIMTSQTL